MKTNSLLLAAVLCAGVSYAGKPSVDSIDYSTPAKYLEIVDTLGNRDQITSLALSLKGSSAPATIKNVLAWMDANLKYDTAKAYVWRNFDDVMREKAFGGCADQGIFCGVLLKAAGIPALWVKTMDVAWIWDFKKGRPFDSWSGHVFLEVYVDGKWMVLDPGGKMLYGDYSPRMRILPGNRFAYDKGNDPKGMILSLQWQEWQEQTKAYFGALDESLLPVDANGGFSLASLAFIAGNSPYYQAMTQMATEHGFMVRKSFNSDYEKFLPMAKGHTLMVEVHNGVPIVPPDLLEKYYPGAAAKGLQNPDGVAIAGDTTILFVEFSKQLDKINR